MPRTPQLLPATAILSTMLLACGSPPDDGIGVVTAASVPPTFIDSNIRGYIRSDGVRAIVFRTTNQNIAQETNTPPATPNVSNLGGTALTAPWGIARIDQANAVYYIGSDSHVHEIVNGQNTDFFTAVGAPKALLGSEIMAYNRSDNRTSLFYVREGDRHIIEVASNFSGSPAWLVGDLTSATSAPLPHSEGKIFAYRRSDNRDAIIFRDDQLKIQEICSNFAGSPAWVKANLMAASGSTSSARTAPWGYKRSDNRNAVVFVASDNKVYELRWCQVSCAGSTSHTWCNKAITGPNAVFARPSGYVRADGKNSVSICRHEWRHEGDNTDKQQHVD